jgi:hypothetical protein
MPTFRLGCPLTTLLDKTAVIAIATPTIPKKKDSLLPILTVLFVISYSLMTVLIVEQGSVIQSQGSVIKVLLRDSVELWGMKGKAKADKQIAKAPGQNSEQAPSTQAPARSQSSQIPSAQVPSSQSSTATPSTQTPSTQGVQQHATSRSGKVAKPGIQAPPIPAADLVDHRRALVTI